MTLWLYVTGLVAIVVATMSIGDTYVRQVRGVSMEPTIADRAYVLVTPATPDVVKRGDLLLLHSPWVASADAVKRLVGIPGDCIANDGKRVLDVPQPCVAVTGNRLFVVGDNRAHSTDSRHLGMVSQQAIVGRVVGILWPPSQMRWFARPF